MKEVKNYCVLDIETTGLSKYKDEIIEIACVRVINHQIIDEMSVLVCPNNPIPPLITKITGITNEMVKRGISIEEALIQLYDFVGDEIIVGHNIGFDMGFIRYHSEKNLGLCFDNIELDTMKIARKEIVCVNYKLATLCSYFNIVNRQAHRALADVYATYELLENLQKKT